MTWNSTQDWAWKHKVLLPLPLECWLKAYTIRSVFLSLKMLTFKFTIKMMFLDNCHYWLYFKQVIEHINYKHAMLTVTHISVICLRSWLYRETFCYDVWRLVSTSKSLVLVCILIKLFWPQYSVSLYLNPDLPKSYQECYSMVKVFGLYSQILSNLKIEYLCRKYCFIQYPYRKSISRQNRTQQDP